MRRILQAPAAFTALEEAAGVTPNALQHVGSASRACSDAGSAATGGTFLLPDRDSLDSAALLV